MRNIYEQIFNGDQLNFCKNYINCRLENEIK